MNGKLPAAVGVPTNVPLAGTTATPGAATSCATLHAYGGVPPLALATNKYGRFRAPHGISLVTMNGAALTWTA